MKNSIIKIIIGIAVIGLFEWYLLYRKDNDLKKLEWRPYPLISTTPTPIIIPSVISKPRVTPMSVFTPTPPMFIPTPSKDNSLKIAQCQAESRNETTKLINSGYQLIDEKLTQQVRNAQEISIGLIREELNRCSIYDQILSPSQNIQLMKQCSDGYDRQISEIRYRKTEWESLIEQAKIEINRLSEQEYNRLYLQCLIN